MRPLRPCKLPQATRRMDRPPDEGRIRRPQLSRGITSDKEEPMMKRRSLLALVAAAALVSGLTVVGAPARAAEKEIVYLTPGLDLPFWRYLSKGVEAAA